MGLGALGSQLARRFLAAHELTVWDINAVAAAEIQKEGATVASTAAELARRCDVVLLCLPRSSDVRQVIFGPGGLAEGLSGGMLVIDQTSGVPAESREIALALATLGVDMMDAAVSASPHVVAQGGATLMASGPDQVVERALPVLHAITPTVYRCGSRVGDGQAMKMVNNAMNGGCRLGTLEVVAMGRKAGLTLECMTAVLNQGDAANQTTEKMLPALLEGKSSTNFALSLMLKDVNQAVALGMDAGVPMPVTSVVRGLLQIGASLRGPDAKLEEMVGLIEAMAGTRLAALEQAPAAAAGVPPAGYGARPKVGYVGLGATGSSLVRRLLLSHAVHVYDANPERVRRLEADGATPVPDLQSLARTCDVIFLCLPTSAEVRKVLLGADGMARFLAAGKVVIDQTSGDPAETAALAVELGKLGVHLLDAPVSGDPAGAAAGAIAIMAGGEADALARVQPLLAAISSRIVHCGQTGNGQLMNLVHNAVSSLGLLLTYECVCTGLKHGLRLKDMSGVLVKGSGWSMSSRKLLPALVAGSQPAGLPLQRMVKDLRLAAGMGIRCGAPMLVSNAVRNLFELGANTYGGDANTDEMTKLYQSMAGVEFKAA
jgi:3-hydroxyisobutyrate dehydrogenase